MDRRAERQPHSRTAVDHEYQRAYQACIPCARRKVKCQTSSSGNPCVRCSKKRIDCVFKAKKPWSRANGEDLEPETRGSRIHKSGTTPVLEVDLNNIQPGQDGLPTSVLQKTVSNSSDAMNLLFEAAVHGDPSLGSSHIRSAHRNCQVLSRATSADADVLRVWNACRFVKMGWFTAQEAMTLVDLFFSNISPLSPILTDFFASRTNQFWLVTQEPMLCCTILLISSRYHVLPGVGGSSRAFFIHYRLWQHCQHLLLRVILGQEKHSKGKTRNVGTIESLLLLSEWYPWSLQFPPESDGWDSDLLMTIPDVRDPPPCMEDIPVSERWREDVVEPTKRFERMSWMVLSSALALAHELGVFRPQAPANRHDELIGADAEMYLAHLDVRRQRLPKLLVVFINVLASRVGCTSPLSPDTPTEWIEHLSESIIDTEWLTFMNSWTELINLTNSITEALFHGSLPAGRTDAFVVELEQKQISLANWRQLHLSLEAPDSAFTDILFIEYQHLRVLINSIGMQWIVQMVLEQGQTQSQHTIDASFIDRARQLNMTTREYGFIEEVIDGCCQTLQKIISLNKKHSLHRSPMRILFRAISSSIFLMKALALGVRSGKLQEALQILDRAITLMQDSSEDDVHLRSRYATLLQVQVSRLRRSLVASYSTGTSLQSQAGIPASTTDIAETSFPTFHGLSQQEETSAPDFSEFPNFDFNDWLSLPLEPSMAPFGSAEPDAGVRLDGVDLDLEFIWQLPP